MENITPEAVLAAVSAFILVTNAAEKIIKAVKAAKAPNDQQNARLDALEVWKQDVERRLLNDNKHLTDIDDGARVTQRALIALLDHGIDGNNIQQMQSAKADLQNHLINR